jgi:ferredoxin-NADP reductase
MIHSQDDKGVRAARSLAGLWRARLPLNRLLSSGLAAALVSPHSVDDYLQNIDPTWSLRAVRARIVGIAREASNVVSLTMVPNENWSGFRAGQFIQLSAPIAGVRTTRYFSLSSAPGDGVPLRVTIKAAETGRLSRWAVNAAAVGDVVEISQADGEFVLPAPLPPKLIFLSGGSGITPLVSLLRHLVTVDYRGIVHFIHYARGEFIFGEELKTLAKTFSPLRLTLIDTRKEGEASRLSREALDKIAPDWQAAVPFVCGPAALITAAAQIWKGAGKERLRIERFTVAAAPAATGTEHAGHRLRFVGSGREVPARANVSLLEQAEAAGLTPEFGCRVGICRTCTTKKVSGTVRNQLTGELCAEPAIAIQLCIHTPESDVTLDL